MSWTDSFWKSIRLKDERLLSKLDDAHKLISMLPEINQGSAQWRDVAESLLLAFNYAQRDG
jgi:hypothetical protein